MTIHRLIPGRVSQEDKQTVVGIVAGGADLPTSRGAYRRPQRDGDIDTRVRFVHDAGPNLPSRDEALHVERPVERGPGREPVYGPGDGRANHHSPHARRQVARTHDGPTA